MTDTGTPLPDLATDGGHPHDGPHGYASDKEA